MMQFSSDSYFSIVADVNDNWARVKGMKNYREEFGIALFRSMFKLAPGAWTVFPWGKGNVSEEELFQNKEFLAFAKRFTEMLDMAIDMLGPDLELVEEQLTQIGVMHIGFGVMPEHYPLMGEALVEVLEQKLGKDIFSAKQKMAWQTTFTFMSTKMLQGAFIELKCRANM